MRLWRSHERWGPDPATRTPKRSSTSWTSSTSALPTWDLRTRSLSTRTVGGVEGHYSTASDVAAFNRFVTNYPKLMEIMGTRSYTTSNGLVTVTNTNRSLAQFPSVEAGKTGFDNDAGWCLVNIARRGETEIIAVTLDGIAPGDWYDDNATLLEFGFDQKAALATSGESFDGDVAGYTDPSIANIERSVTTSASFVPGAAASLARSLPENETNAGDLAVLPVVEASEPQTISESSFWVAAMSVLGLLGVRGLLTFKRPQPRVTTSATPVAPVDIGATGS